MSFQKLFIFLTERSVKNMPRTPDQNKEIRTEKRTRIVNSAIELFAEKGYYNTTIEMISKHAGISKGLIYTYFESKEQLLKIVFSEITGKMLNNLDPNQDGILEKHELINYVNITIDDVKKNLHFWKLYHSIAIQPQVLEILKDEMKLISSPIVNMMSKYFKDQGYKNPDIEMAVFASFLSGAIIKYIGAPDWFPIDEVKIRIIDMYK